MTLNELGRHAADQFAKAYGRQPRWLAAAPGRVNVIGEQTDYNDGFVFPMAFDRYTVIASAPAPGDRIELRSLADKTPAQIDPGRPLKPESQGAWSNYPLGV